LLVRERRETGTEEIEAIRTFEKETMCLTCREDGIKMIEQKIHVFIRRGEGSELKTDKDIIQTGEQRIDLPGLKRRSNCSF
jgi:hypothetical protein